MSAPPLCPVTLRAAAWMAFAAANRWVAKADNEANPVVASHLQHKADGAAMVGEAMHGVAERIEAEMAGWGGHG